MTEHQIIRDHETNRSRGFGFIVFDKEEVVDELLSKGNMVDMEGTQVSSMNYSDWKTHVSRECFYLSYLWVCLCSIFIRELYEPVLS